MLDGKHASNRILKTYTDFIIIFPPEGLGKDSALCMGALAHALKHQQPHGRGRRIFLPLCVGLKHARVHNHTQVLSVCMCPYLSASTRRSVFYMSFLLNLSLSRARARSLSLSFSLSLSLFLSLSLSLSLSRPESLCNCPHFAPYTYA